MTPDEVRPLDGGVIGNCSFGALIDPRGRICWACLPHFDGDPVFHSLLGAADEADPEADEKQLLAIFKRRIFPEIDPGPEQEIIERLRVAIFGDEREVEPRTVVLASLAKAVGLLNLIFGRKELRSRKQRLVGLAKGDVVGRATAEAVAATQAAVAAAAAMPAIIAASQSG